ncbi:hypothetical protein PVE_R1G3984 [Pseudomonas veronii 1YdBTEX2]|uniref:Uncharacterized protein n=1 Tax=Pseudomonas veronii 1YdBTEX2 TaxID=1295141 RepID=A0A1D3K0J5_PSEVE|nr:hypothetical protein PVE_R1G3984 [Pseudomonas veronii 1YdBTEX2]
MINSPWELKWMNLVLHTLKFLDLESSLLLQGIAAKNV